MSSRKLRWIVILSTLFLLIIVFLLVFKACKPPSASAIKLVNDYNQGEGQNFCGGKVFSLGSKDAFAKIRYGKEDAYGGKGLSAEISFYVPEGGWAAWGEDLNELDISAAQKFSFKVKGSKGQEAFEVHIKDKDGHEAGVDVLYYSKITPKWQEVVIPIGDFKGINFNHLDSVVFIFRGFNGEKSGVVYFDDIIFRGRPELFFNSIKDNLQRFPRKLFLNGRKKQISDIKSDKQMLLEIARDTWGYFKDCFDLKRNLPPDFIELCPERRIGDYASPTNMGLYYLSIISAMDLRFVSREEALSRLKKSLETIDKLPKRRGFFYNFYNTTNLQITRRYISSVDNAWFSAALIIVRQVFPELAPECTELLRQQDYSDFYNQELGHINLGYDTEEGTSSSFNYGLLCTETRIISIIGIGKRDLPEEHWFKMFRTLPAEWNWQSQVPEGITKKYIDVEVFEGYYTYDGIKIVPSWGGSLFEFLMPTLVVKEKELAPLSLGLNNLRAVEAHIKYAAQKGYPVWGLSPCSTPDGSYGGYSEFGIAAIGAKGYKDEGIVTAHVSFLALDPAPEEAIKNIRRFLGLKDIYGEYGLYDAVNIKTREVSKRYLTLDQGMILCAINNYLNHGILKERFHKDGIGERFEKLLGVEEFSIVDGKD